MKAKDRYMTLNEIENMNADKRDYHVDLSSGLVFDNRFNEVGKARIVRVYGNKEVFV